MAIEPQKLTISIDGEPVSGLLYAAARKTRLGITLILGHGAGANQLHPFMRLFASGLAERCLDVLTFNFKYMEQGRRVPDPKAKLEACYRAVMAAAQQHKQLSGNRLVIGGKSMGGRIASQVAAQPESADEVAALVFLGYPLHPPGKPEQRRDAHLPDIKAPMLFVQGSRDAFGTSEELQAIIPKLRAPAKLYTVEAGDHSFKVPKRAGVLQESELYAAGQDAEVPQDGHISVFKGACVVDDLPHVLLFPSGLPVDAFDDTWYGQPVRATGQRYPDMREPVPLAEKKSYLRFTDDAEPVSREVMCHGYE
jgi:predicted alpha/beta-hydrolase family hydrolase